MKTSPTLSVPFCTSTVATGPRPLSMRDSSTVPLPGASGSALSSRRSATSRIISSSLRKILLGLGGDLDHHRVAAPFLGHQAAIGELALHFFGLGIRLVNLVDRDDDRHIRGLRVRDRFFGLRHHAVVRAHHQHHDVGHFRAARAHARERFVARRIDEHDAAVAHVHLIRADMLRDSARFARGNFGFADGVEQAGLAVVHVAHHGHHRSARQQISGALFLDLFFLDQLLFERHHLHDSVERFGQARRRLHVERLVDAGENCRDRAASSAIPWRECRVSRRVREP